MMIFTGPATLVTSLMGPALAHLNVPLMTVGGRPPSSLATSFDMGFTEFPVAHRFASDGASGILGRHGVGALGDGSGGDSRDGSISMHLLMTPEEMVEIVQGRWDHLRSDVSLREVVGEETTNQIFQKLSHMPLVLRPDNFTTETRTPWGGTRIREMMRPLGVPQGGIVGEAWSISGHPSYPSRTPILVQGRLFEIPISDIGAFDPETFYGKKHVARLGSQTPFLIKLLNSNQNLSVQIHPGDGYRDRAHKHQPSKTEAWVILEAEEGAGLYLGLQEGVTREKMEAALRVGEDISQFLNFVIVAPGDVFFIPPGTPHAIGAGILLLEPQETSESTFRYYDWGRGGADGRPRELHIDDALAVTDWNAPRGLAGIRSHLQRSPIHLSGGTTGLALHERLVESEKFSLERLTFETQDSFEGNTQDTLHGLTVTSGEVHLVEKSKDLIRVFRAGESLMIPAAMGPYHLHAPTDAVLYITYSR